MDCAVITDNRIASDLDGRIAENEQFRLESGVFGNTTVTYGCNAIDIGTRFSRHNTDCVKIFAGDLNTILVPYEVVSAITNGSHRCLRTNADGVRTDECDIRNGNFNNCDIDRINT